jgi:DNA repair protein RecN (Recombination protein N)
MLKYLSIKNFALIENCEINISDGLNIITGETGAGKSIMIQALAILLGGRASVEHIRTGMEEAVLNATIDIANQTEIMDYLKSIGITVEDDELIIRRILSNNGKSRSFINGTQVTSKEVGFISSILFDFHGQHEGISLLKKQTHLRYLDNFLHIESELKTLNNIYRELKKTEESLKFLNDSKKDKEKRLELLKHEIEEISSSNIKDQEDEELKREIKIYENIEKIMSSLEESSRLFAGEDGINSRLRNVKNLISHVSEVDQTFNNISNDLSDVFYKLEDIAQEIISKKDRYDFDSVKLDRLIERSELIEKLKRKYGGSIDKIREYLDTANKELKLIEFSSEESEKLSKYLNELKDKYITLASNISKKRREGALVLEKKVKEELMYLAMNNVEFKINIEFIELDNDDGILLNNKKLKYSEDGIDDVEFLISPNKGEPLKSLIKIASGGELSRIILALKSVLVENDNIHTMIFDEIDAGIGGKVALSVGKSLKRISNYKQIICITHLPQIAACGSKNFLISKKISGDRTITSIEVLDKNNKIKEIARMLSGNITNVSLEHAKELIYNMENDK